MAAPVTPDRASSAALSDKYSIHSYFTMHGENLDRMQGRAGRGKFGTGKSAAFGIGNVLVIDTRRNGCRNVVRLDRTTIESSSGGAIDLEWIIRDEETTANNGTSVTIEQVFLPKVNTAPIVEYIERHLQVFRARMPEVAVNDHVCQYREPVVAQTYTFWPTPAQAEMIGVVELSVKVAMAPLPKAELGIAVTAGLGNLVGIESCGIEGKELGNYLFGHVDVPALEAHGGPIEPYDSTRSLQLNPQHPVVSILLAFLGSKLEEVRKEYVQSLRAARQTENARRLAAEAQRIADILNSDFKSVMGRLQVIRSASAHPGDLGSRFGSSKEGDSDEGVWVEGSQIPGEVASSAPGRNPTDNEAEKKGRPDPDVNKDAKPASDGQRTVDPSGGEGTRKKNPRGGFNVEFRNLGEASDRSKYDRTALSILINLDHPAVKNALRSGGVDDINFRRLSYEIAFTEYSIAFGYEMSEQDPDIPADDLLYEVRSTLNRISTSAAPLYI